ncbi:MAG: biotin--[Synergistaceae bacterium]|nr:biotin--[acetyl-CoA-carboxylase] ligase [Synergistaceae bacterium]
MKTKLLHYLESRRGEFVSGESIAEEFGVTRAGVWKAVDSLRKEGHVIRAATNRGYSLVRSSDVLTAEGIRANLKPDTRVSKVLCLSEVDSTNNYAKRLALSGASHGTLIAANHQTSGRGRHGHTFESPAGTGLYMSLILKPNVDVERFQMITIADAVAVCLAVEELYPESRGHLGIKWVNDIHFNGRKITGILTEAVSNFESGEIESVVTGIGINVTTKKFPAEFAERAGAIFDGDDYAFGRDELCAHVADYIMDFAENLGSPGLINAYRERSILTGQDITYMKNDVKSSGHVEGIDDSGGLVVVNDAGEIETLRSGEVFMVRQKERI